MKTLGLLRHAKSDWDDLTLRDFDRGLNARGMQGAGLMGAHIMAHGPVWDMVLASTAQRVRCTLAGAALPAPVEWLQDAYLADAATLADLVRRHGGPSQAVLLAGHNPGLQELLLDLVAPDAEDALFDTAMTKFPTAAFAVVELDIANWADLASGCGRLVHFARPRDLDPQLGPQVAG